MASIAGFCFIDPTTRREKYLPQVKLEAHASIISSLLRTTITQTFVNHDSGNLPEVRYSFPLYDGVSVVAFTCTIGDRCIKGVVKEKQKAREEYQEAVARGDTAGLLEQLPASSDVFTTTIGNVAAGVTITVNIAYLGELKHDAQVDGIRLTIPASIAPRYGTYPGELANPHLRSDGGMRITVDAEVPTGSHITSIHSPSHQLAVTLGRTSVDPDAELSFQKASATLALGTAELEKDFILQVKATNTGNPIAILEEHPSLPNQRALMATLVPKFSLPSEKPEIVFVCDRSGSMGDGHKIPNLRAALRLFVKSLNVGTKFNICSFGTHYTFLWDRSRSYDQTSVDEAMTHIETLAANYGGTEMCKPVEDTFKRRYTDMNLEVFLLTDGQIWGHTDFMSMVSDNVSASNGAIRVFTLGIGRDVSHSLLEGIARAGNGFSQSVSDSEEMSSKVVRMLKGALFPHIKDYSLEVKYVNTRDDAEDDFEIIEKISDVVNVKSPDPISSESTITEERPKVPISLFDPSVDLDGRTKDAENQIGDRYAHLPTVDPPKLLQAPFSIPPLFPFNRTSVYVLMAADAAQQTPKSVVLRGTSTHGPLELEIPIVVLSKRAETIHQLAAKKAVGELEEGRGWVYCAKSSEGILLKDKYDGRFQDMVEREAVRLGVLYQVGGRYCSFVAVENGSVDKPMVTPSRDPEESEFTAARKRGASAAREPAASLSKGMLPGPHSMFGSLQARSFPQHAHGLGGTRDPGISWERRASGEAPTKQETLPQDKLNALILLHRFEGFWTWDQKLQDLMLWDADATLQPVQVATQEVVAGSNGQNIIATACVVAWLRSEKAAEKDTWELLVEKAVLWLENELGPKSAGTVIEAAGRVV
ncbi:von Willebrand factor type A domain-containing protein [Xylariales sp. AK1849]|nr:von Willebrand factor type A domain-containing protein [Xylariales sp. AK1849]